MILEIVASVCMFGVSVLQVWLLSRQASIMENQTAISERLENLQRVLAEKALGITPKRLDELMEKDRKREGVKPVPKDGMKYLE